MTVSLAVAQDFFLVLTRTLAILSAAPVLGGRNVPAQVRIGLGLLLAAVLLPAAPGRLSGEVSQPLASFLWDVARELITGILAGMAVRLAFAALESAAALMGATAGFSAGAVLNPALDQPGTAFDQFYMLAAVLIFLVTNGHHQLILGLARTFELAPLRSLALEAGGQGTLIRLSASMLAAAVQIALPVMATMILLDLALGLTARVAPQVQVFFLGAPLKVGVGLLGLAAALPLLAPAMTALFGNMAAHMNALIR